MPLIAASSPHAASSVPTSKREQLEDLLAESLPVLYQVEVRGRSGTKKGRLGNIGLSFTYDDAADETAPELSDQVCDAIEEHALNFGSHVYEIHVYVSAEGQGEAQLLPQTVQFIIDRGSATAAIDNPKDLDLERLKHSNKTIRELEGIIARQAKSAESLVALATSTKDLLRPHAEVEVKRLEVAERAAEREAEAVETAEQMQTAREVLAPVFVQLVPSINNLINAYAAKAANTGDSVPTEPTTPPWEQAASLLSTLSDEQRVHLRDELGRETWTHIQHLGDVDSDESFAAIVDDVKGSLTMASALACQAILSPEQCSALMGLIQ